MSIFLNFLWHKVVSIVNMIKCTKINPSEKVFTLIVVTIANVKGCVHSRKNFYRRGTRGFFQNFSGREPEVVKFVFSYSKLRKQTFLLKIFNLGGPRLPCPPSDAHGSVRIRNDLTTTI